MKTTLIDIKNLVSNTGQLKGLPKNPRIIRDERFKALVKSIQDDPEMLDLRECIVVPHNDKFVVIAGNMRLKACKELGLEKIPCKVLDAKTPVEKLKAITIKDNVPFGEHDFDLLANEWEFDELKDWGLDLPKFEESQNENEDNVKDENQFIIAIDCKNEDEQQMLYDEFEKRGLKCKLIM